MGNTSPAPIETGDTDGEPGAERTSRMQRVRVPIATRPYFYSQADIMHVTELDASHYPECIVGTPTESDSERSVGTLHLSRIYRDMEEEAQLRKKGTATLEDLAWYAAGGWMWEWAFSMAHRAAVMHGESSGLVRPDEWTRDGVTGSPDALRLDPYRVVELKCRWQSAQKFDQLEKNYWLELMQIMGYCKMVGTDEAELHVFFVCGNWRPPIPMVRSALIRFNQQELDSNWSVILNHARRKGWL